MDGDGSDSGAPATASELNRRNAAVAAPWVMPTAQCKATQQLPFLKNLSQSRTPLDPDIATSSTEALCGNGCEWAAGAAIATANITVTAMQTAVRLRMFGRRSVTKLIAFNFGANEHLPIFVPGEAKKTGNRLACDA